MATSVQVAACFGGIIVSFALPPHIVPSFTEGTFTDGSLAYAAADLLEDPSLSDAAASAAGGSTDLHHHGLRQAALRSIRQLYCVGAAVACLMFGGLVLMFPERPPTAPSAAAHMRQQVSHGGGAQARTQRLDRRKCGMFAEWYALMGSARFLGIAACYALPAGVQMSWSSVLATNLGSHGFSQEEAGWVGCWATVAGCAGAVGAGALADRVRSRQRKRIVSGLYLAALVGAVLFAASCEAASPSSSALVASAEAGWSWAPSRRFVVFAAAVLAVRPCAVSL